MGYDDLSEELTIYIDSIKKGLNLDFKILNVLLSYVMVCVILYVRVVRVVLF